MNYEFNTSERQIFLAHYQTTTYSQTSLFLKKFLDNKLKGFLIGDINIDDSDDIDASHAIDDSETIDRDLDTELELLTMMNALNMDMLSKIDRFYITLQFELAKVKVLASKYLLGNDQGWEKRKISTIWASLKKVNGLRWAVGDGNSISYWDDDWCSTPISLELGMSDCLCWKHSKDGRLSLANAYDLVTKRKKLPVTGKEERWKRLWKLKVFPKLRGRLVGGIGMHSLYSAGPPLNGRLAARNAITA
ncbi:hypothetical protein Godav_011265 [Gossypium davidsonii]|uniref:Reverse transcriptase zinc-binding domain-containing protein n=1 Tax=Gossypium davidsonii TaxID=34287 RepID=A0A7J8R9K5_GOSDV|nr:hypothetical protein [Gossypium davidsonii]